MVRTILIQGKSGSGKSTSLRNLDPAKTVLLTPNNKPLPFAGAGSDYQIGRNVIFTQEVSKIGTLIEGVAGKKPEAGLVMVVEDFTHYMNHKTLAPHFYNDKEWSKWNKFGAEVYSAVAGTALTTKHDDMSVVLMGHVEVKDDGTINLKTSGKMLDREVDIPSYVTYQLYAHIIIGTGGKRYHAFMTNGTGTVEAKTPMYLYLHSNIPNDLNKVLERIRIYESLPREIKGADETLLKWSQEMDEKQYPGLDWTPYGG